MACFSALYKDAPTAPAAATAIPAGEAILAKAAVLTPNLEPNASAVSVRVLIDALILDKLLFGTLPRLLFILFWICSSSL